MTMKINYFSIILLVGLVLTFSSCSEYQQLLKSGDYNMKYEKAVEYYNAKDYYRAQTLFDDIVTIFKGTSKAEDISFYYADCHFKQRDYILGAYYFENFAKTYPYSPRAEEAYFNSAYCYYMNSPRASLDQTDTRKAIDAMQLFINKHPTSPKVNSANAHITELRGKLEEKSFMNSRMYFKLADYQAASISLKNSIKDYPDSPYREEVLYLIIKSSYLLAEGSVQSRKGERYQTTVSDYYVFIDEYPESKYAKEIEKMYTESVNQIKKL